MSAYYFLVAQLPALAASGAPVLAAAEVDELCLRLMSAADAALVPACRLEGTAGAAPTGSRLIDGWTVWDGALRRHLAKARAARLDRDPAAYSEAPPEPSSAAAAARAALACESPLEAEIVLHRARWDALDVLVGVDGFSREIVYAYILKTRLLERRVRFETEAGFAAYRAAYAAVLEAANVSLSPGESS